MLARAYHGASLDAMWADGKFVEPDTRPPFRIKFKRRRGFQDTARIEFDQDSASVTIRNPYQSGRAELTRTGDAWPAEVTIRLLKRNPEDPKDAGPRSFRMANGRIALGMTFEGERKIIAGKLEGQLDLGKPWGEEEFLTKQCLETNARLQLPNSGEIEGQTRSALRKQGQPPLSGKPESPVTLKDIRVSSEGEALEIVVPAAVAAGNPDSLVIEWGNAR